MYRCITEITIDQQGPGRALHLFFNYVSEFNSTDTWVDLTNDATVKLPKNLYARDANNKLYPLFGTNKNIGGFDSNPLFLRGDKISISYGYLYFDTLGNPVKNISNIFIGFITDVSSKKPIELKCEDNMWKLKQLPAKPQVWKGTVEDLFVNLLTGTNFTVNKLTKTNIGPFVVGNETIAQLLERLRKEANLESYFRGNELRVGSLVYIESESKTYKFIFQQNIISDELVYKRKDDVTMSAIVISKFDDFTGKITKDGQAKTKKEQIEILVYWDVKTSEWKYIKKVKGQELPPNVEGERRTLHFSNVTDENVLFNNGINELKKYFYTGFRGKFLTFAIPFVKQGDYVQLIDAILPERNGTYKVKGVEYSGGTSGNRQSIMLDYKKIL